MKRLLRSLSLIIILMSCLYVCACDNPNGDSQWDRDTTTMDVSTRKIADGFECSKNQALLMEDIFEKCLVSVQSSSYVGRDSNRDWGETYAYVVRWDVTINGNYSKERFYVYLDSSKKIVDIRIWSNYLYKDYKFVQTAKELYNKLFN